MSIENFSSQSYFYKKLKIRITTIVFLILVMLLGFMTVVFNMSKELTLVELNHIQQKLMDFEKVASKLLFYDELLTSTTRLYVLTKDRLWVSRYEKYEPLLETELKKFKTIFPTIKFSSETEKHNESLVKMEKMSFDMAKKGKSAKANSIIYSKEYETHKKQYQRGLVKTSGHFKQNIFSELIALERKSSTYNVIEFILLTFTLFGWLIIYFRFRTENLELSKLSQILKLKVDEQTHKYNTEKIKSLELANHFKSLFQSTPVPIIIYNDKGILDCNSSAIQYFEAKNVSSIYSKSPLDFFPEFQPDGSLSSETFKAKESQVLVNKQSKFDWEITKLNGIRATVEVTLTLIELNNRHCIISLWNDLTEKKTREKLMLHNSKMASLGQISAGISHEIKNPLSIICGAVDLIPKYLSYPDQLHSKLRIINNSIDRITNVIDGLQKFAQSSKLMPFSFCSIRRILKESILLIENKAKRHSIQINFEPEFDVQIFCNEVEIQQVVINLLINSIDAIKTKSNRWIEIKLKANLNHIYLLIIDSGTGVPKTIEDKVFEPFYTTKSAGEGVGLGLSIAKGIIEAHDASISILDNVPNTTFEIRFKKIQFDHSLLHQTDVTRKTKGLRSLFKKVS